VSAARGVVIYPSGSKGREESGKAQPWVTPAPKGSVESIELTILSRAAEHLEEKGKRLGKAAEKSSKDFYLSEDRNSSVRLVLGRRRKGEGVEAQDLRR